MLTAIVAAMIVGIFNGAAQVLAKRAIDRRLSDMRVDMMREACRAADHAHTASVLADDAVMLLRPAIAQLPKTRSRKTAQAGIGEAEVSGGVDGA